MKKSRTQQALDILRLQPERSHYSVCKEVGLSQPVLSRAVKVIREREALARNQGAQP